MSDFTDSVGRQLTGVMGGLLYSLRQGLEDIKESRLREAHSKARKEQSEAKYWEDSADTWEKLYMQMKTNYLRLEKAVGILEERLEKANSKLEQSQNDYNALKSEYDKLFESNDWLQREFSRLKHRAELGAAKLEGYERQSSEYETKIAALEARVRELDAVLEQERQRVQALHTSEQHVKAQLEKAHQSEQSVRAQLEQTRTQLVAQIEQLRMWHAANLALRCAIEMQLLRHDPANPLLRDQDLRDRVRRAGEMAVAMLANAQDDPNAPDPFDMAREAGLTFSVPGSASSADVLADLALSEVYMRRLVALGLNEERAVQVLERVSSGASAAEAAREVLQQVEPGSVLLQPDTRERVRAIAAEEFQRQQQQRRMQRVGPSAAWSAAMLGYEQVRERVLQEIGGDGQGDESVGPSGA